MNDRLIDNLKETIEILEKDLDFYSEKTNILSCELSSISQKLDELEKRAEHYENYYALRKQNKSLESRIEQLQNKLDKWAGDNE